MARRFIRNKAYELIHLQSCIGDAKKEGKSCIFLTTIFRRPPQEFRLIGMRWTTKMNTKLKPTLSTRLLVLLRHKTAFSETFPNFYVYFKDKWANTMHVCTYLIAFNMMFTKYEK